MTPSLLRRQAVGLVCGLSGLGIGASIALATTVFACTDIMGPLTLTPTAGPAGTVVKMSATGLKTLPARYEIHYTTAAGSNTNSCMSFSTGVQILKANIPTNRHGKFTVSVAIPSNASQGTHNVCGMEVYPTQGATGTTHQIFTVT